MHLSKFPAFIEDCAYEYAKTKMKNPKLARDDENVAKYIKDFRERIKKGDPGIKETVILSIVRMCECVCVCVCFCFCFCLSSPLCIYLSLYLFP